MDKPRNNEGYTWSEKYSTGIERLDQDHQFIFELLDQSCSCPRSIYQSNMALHIINSLMDLSQTHFRDEELWMQKIKCKDYDQHVAFHQLLLERIGDLYEQIRLGYTAKQEDIIVLLKDWIESDIIHLDNNFKNL